MPGTFPSPGEIVETRIVSATTRQTGLNVQHWFTQTTTTGGASLQEIATAYDTRIAALYKLCLTSEATYRGVGATNLATPRSREFAAIGNAGVGLGAAPGAPTQVRGLISWYANAAGARNRGRTYIPFVPGSSVGTGGDPIAAYITRLIAVRDQMLPNLFVSGAGGTTNLQLCLTHRPPVLIGPSIVVSSIVRVFFATQRRSGAFGRQNQPPF